MVAQETNGHPLSDKSHPNQVITYNFLLCIITISSATVALLRMILILSISGGKSWHYLDSIPPSQDYESGALPLHYVGGVC